MGKTTRQKDRIKKHFKRIAQPNGTIACHKCGKYFPLDEITVDRYPIPGCFGGTYRLDNVQPACFPCNQLNGEVLTIVTRVLRGG